VDYNERDRIDKVASQFWSSFADEVIYHNRFHPSHPLLLFLRDYLHTHVAHLGSGTILYRARVIDYDKQDAENTGIVKFIHNEEWGAFEGYDEKNSYVPPAVVVSAGRANPERIVYLYAAKEIITAIGETRPRIFDHISVAKIQLLKDIKLADFTHVTYSDEMTEEQAKINQIIHAFSRPCKDAVDYIPTQFIAEYVKTLGFDGIAFNSSFVPGGTNLTIFFPDVAKAIASAPYRMDSIIYRARRIAPLKYLDAFDIIATNENDT